MNSWHLCLHLILPLLFAPEPKAEDVEDWSGFAPKEIDPEQFDLKINTSNGITVKWWTPEEYDVRCYRSEVQYKNQCGKNWTTIEYENKQVLNVLSLSTLSMKQNYDFRIRMKLSCGWDGNWTNWTRIQSWGNNPDACIGESSSNLWIYILITVLPLGGLLLICLLTRESGGAALDSVMKNAKQQKLKLSTKVKIIRMTRL